MTDHNSNTAVAERIKRAHKILDAAVDLVLRWGYNKTTIDDIAKQAEVGKGTVYLHWKTRDDLFKTLIRREQVAISEAFPKRIAADPQGARLGNILKHTMILVMERPLLKALMLGDKDVWGKMLEGAYGNSAFIEKMAGFETYIEFLSKRDLVRKDLSAKAQVAMCVAIVIGFFTVGPVLPEAYQQSDEELADLMSEVIRNTFEPKQEILHQELQEATTAFLEYTTHIANVLTEQFHKEMENSK
ncbi:MAG: TetR/AcrR family transcriptional regulator [Chloroflexota bacterium]